MFREHLFGLPIWRTLARVGNLEEEPLFNACLPGGYLPAWRTFACLKDTCFLVYLEDTTCLPGSHWLNLDPKFATTMARPIGIFSAFLYRFQIVAVLAKLCPTKTLNKFNASQYIRLRNANTPFYSEFN